MGSSYSSLLDMLIEARDADYRSDPERNEARLNMIESVMQTLLEKLRDQFDRR